MIPTYTCGPDQNLSFNNCSRLSLKTQTPNASEAARFQGDNGEVNSLTIQSSKHGSRKRRRYLVWANAKYVQQNRDRMINSDQYSLVFWQKAEIYDMRDLQDRSKDTCQKREMGAGKSLPAGVPAV